ncbi:MAG: hypothetical protein V1694_09255 [Candidatus Eisenbacteria bacterium]
MKILSLVALGLGFVSALLPAPAAGVPCAGTSTVVAVGEGTPGCNPNIPVVCPAGDKGMVKVTVTVRDCYGTPLANQSVTCNAIPASGAFCFCTGEDPQVGRTDNNGQVFYVYDNFGGCGDLQFSAVCQGVTLGPSNIVSIRSPDSDGSCSVNSVDLSRFASRYGTTDTCCDYNCDGIVNSIDLSTFALHYGHVCP